MQLPNHLSVLYYIRVLIRDENEVEVVNREINIPHILSVYMSALGSYAMRTYGLPDSMSFGNVLMYSSILSFDMSMYCLPTIIFPFLSQIVELIMTILFLRGIIQIFLQLF